MRRTAFHRSIIRSDERLDYPRVDRIFAGDRARRGAVGGAAGRRPRAPRRRCRRRASSAARWPSSPASPSSRSTREGHVTELAWSEQTESHRLIEHLMIAANEAVATLLEARKLPALYRVHERPEPARVEHLAEQLASLDVPTPPVPETMTPAAGGRPGGRDRAPAWTARCAGAGHGRAALTVARAARAQAGALLAAQRRPRRACSSPRYCHFTSPIRRYPDLICHRALLAAVGAGEDAPRASDMEGAGEWCSLRERDAMAIERQRRRDRALLPARGRAVRARLAHASGAGEVDRRDRRRRVRRLRRAATRACCPVRSLRGDWWELNELETMLIGAQSRQRDPARRPGRRAGRARRRAARPRGPLAGRANLERRSMPPRDVATNRQASHRYHLLDKWEAGIVLHGTEVKALRDGKAQIKDGYASCATARCGCTTSTSRPTARRRARTTSPSARASCSCTSAEIDRLIGKHDARRASRSSRRGCTSATGAPRWRSRSRSGKDVGDKRQAIKEREMKREMDRAMRR